MAHITSKEVLKQITQEFTDTTDRIWFKSFKIVDITKNLKL